MKEKTIFVLLMLITGVVFAQATTQTQPAPPAPPTAPQATTTDGRPLAQILGWMVGNWEGEGVMQGDQEFIGQMEVTSELDDQAILIQRESASKAGIQGGRKEIMVIGYEASTKKIVMTLHTSGNFIGLYTGELRGNNEIVFNLATAQQGYVGRRIFKMLPGGGVSFIIEGGSPGKAVGKLVEINFKKKI